MYKENWENVFGEELDNTKIIGAKKVLTLLFSPHWSVRNVQEFYKNGSITPPKTHIYRSDRERNRDWNRHAHCSYRTRKELEEVAENPEVIDKLIERGILELHKKWRYPKPVHNPDTSHKTYKLMEQIWAGKHPQALYRLNLGALYEIVYGEEAAKEKYGALLYGHLMRVYPHGRQRENTWKLKRALEEFGRELEFSFKKLEERMDSLEQRIDGLEQRVDNLEQRIDGLEEKFNGLEETLDLQWESIKFLLASPPNQEINLGCYMRDGTGYNSRRVKWIPHPLFHN